MKLFFKKNVEIILVVLMLTTLVSVAFSCFFLSKGYAIDEVNATVVSDTDEHVVVQLKEHANFDDGEYVTEDWIDINNNEVDEIETFGKAIDYIKYEVEWDSTGYMYSFFVFDVEDGTVDKYDDLAGVNVTIYDSKNPVSSRISDYLEVNPLDWSDPGTVRVCIDNNVDYDTIEFSPAAAKVIKSNKDIIQLQLYGPNYNAPDFFDINGNYEDEISCFGQVFDKISYRRMPEFHQSRFKFETVGDNTGVYVEIYNSANKEATVQRHVVGECGSEEVQVGLDDYFDRMDFYPYKATVTKIEDSLIQLKLAEPIYQQTTDKQNGEIISNGFRDINGNFEDHLSVFGQKINAIGRTNFRFDWHEPFDAYEELLFHTDNEHGVICSVYDSENKDGTIVQGIIGVDEKVNACGDPSWTHLEVPHYKGLENALELQKKTKYDTIEFMPYNGRVVKDDKSSVVVKTFDNHRYFDDNQHYNLEDKYVCENWTDINHHDVDKITAFEQTIDWIKYVDYDNKEQPRFEFDTEGVHGLNVSIYNSADKEGTRVRGVIGWTHDDTDFIFVKKNVLYDTIEFEPLWASVTKMEPNAITLKIYGNREYRDEEYISEDFFDINGEEQEKIEVFGQTIDWIRYEGYQVDEDSDINNPHWRFDTEGKCGVFVELYDSTKPEESFISAVIGNTYADTDVVRLKKDFNYDTLRFIPYFACVTKIDSDSIVLNTYGNRQFSDGDYISEDFIDINGNFEEKVSTFGQITDWIQYKEDSSNKSYWSFDTEGVHGVIVNIYNSQDKANTLVQDVIGNNYDDTDSVYVKKGVHYDTIEFKPFNAKVLSQSSTSIKVKMPLRGLWKTFKDDDYITCNWTDINGHEEEEISVHGQIIDYIQYELRDGVPYFVFDTDGVHGVKVKIYDSTDPEHTSKTAYIGTSIWTATESVKVDPAIEYDTLEFIPA